VFICVRRKPWERLLSSMTELPPAGACSNAQAREA
jgi:hypothetical protein